MSPRRWLVLMLTLWAMLARPAFAAPTDGSVQDADEDCARDVGACPIDLEGIEDEPDASLPAEPAPSPAAPELARKRLLFFWGIGCPHCEDAKPFLSGLEQEGVAVERVEVRQDAAGRERFIESMRHLGAGALAVKETTGVVGVGGAQIQGRKHGRSFNQRRPAPAPPWGSAAPAAIRASCAGCSSGATRP